MGTTETLGVDVGGVILDRANDGAGKSFLSDKYLMATPVMGAIEALGRLVRERFGDRVYVVSKCGQKVQDKTLHWMDHHWFWLQTGIDPARIRFCRERHEKAPICAELGITHFIDDRLEVLSHLATVPHRFLFHPRDQEVERFRDHLSGVVRVENWSEILARLLPGKAADRD